jgi:hypothetical protein
VRTRLKTRSTKSLVTVNASGMKHRDTSQETWGCDASYDVGRPPDSGGWSTIPSCRLTVRGTRQTAADISGYIQLYFHNAYHKFPHDYHNGESANISINHYIEGITLRVQTRKFYEELRRVVSFELPQEIWDKLSSFRGSRWRSCLRHCATSRKVAGSIPDGVTGIFH